MLTTKQVRERLGIGRAKLAELIQTGELEAIKTGDAPNARYRISEKSLDSYIERRKVVPAQAAS